jgi:hypothetical protein
MSVAELKKEVEGIKKKSIVRLSNGEPMKYHITYDTFGQTLEPVYFWTLDFLRSSSPSGLGFDVSKVEEEFEASAGGAYFGELGARASAMQDRAMAILRQVNGVIKEVINLIYDLKEYEMRLEVYDHADPKKEPSAVKRESAEHSLKSIWMDQVDVKTGLGSINNLTRGDLQFVTLRDAFMQAKSIKDVDRIDLNKRVKIILKKKFEEYSNWRGVGEDELRKRFSIEKNYLKSQIDSLKLYTKWAKPYLRAAQKLGMKEMGGDSRLANPDIVAAFNNMQMELSLLAKKEIKLDSDKKFKNKYYACIVVDFVYRTAPQAVRSGQSTHYAHVGIIDVYFKAYAFTDKELEKVQRVEVYEDMELVDHLTDVSLKDLTKDLDHFLDDEEEVEEKKVFVLPNPLKGFKELVAPLKNVPEFFGDFKPKGTSYQESKLKAAAKAKAKGSCLTLYDVFKKAHRMITW